MHHVTDIPVETIGDYTVSGQPNDRYQCHSDYVTLLFRPQTTIATIEHGSSDPP